MSDIQIAGYEHAGRCCRRCHDAIEDTDVIAVNPDAEYDDEGIARDMTTVTHHPVCPPDEAA